MKSDLSVRAIDQIIGRTLHAPGHNGTENQIAGLGGGLVQHEIFTFAKP